MADAPADVVDGKLRLPPAVLRMVLWGGGALCALSIMTLSALSETGSQRLQTALNSVVGNPPPVVITQIAPSGPSPETIKLSEDLRQLSAERERLNGRLAKLESMLEDVTGSVKRQAERSEQMARVTPAPTPAPAPVIAPPATVAAAAPPPAATPAPTAPVVAAPAPIAAEPAPAAETIPLPPERVATAEPASVGIDVGGAASADALKAHWTLVKASYGPMLGPLQPLIVTRERKGQPTSYRLVLGPLASTNAAVQVCSRLIAARLNCRPTTFTSQTAAQL
ncbi:MAG: hypothetical protein JO254_14960 [Pseudolabrys sp.]|nr:hypothetical protein [Pseudolabrys sp.]